MKKVRLIGLLIVSTLTVLLAAGGMAFLVTHPRCENCGRRYGPLIPHLYRHQTTLSDAARQAAIQRTRATAPVIQELPPLTDANRNLTLSPQTLVGRWESQDGDRLPLVFHADGSVEVGTIRRNGKWIIAKGTWRIQGDQIRTRTRTDQVSLEQSFRFARGVLYAPKGPSPQVLWKRISDL